MDLMSRDDTAAKIVSDKGAYAVVIQPFYFGMLTSPYTKITSVVFFDAEISSCKIFSGEILGTQIVIPGRIVLQSSSSPALM